MRSLRVIRGNPLGMKLAVDLDRRQQRLALGAGHECPAEGVEPSAPALGTGAVPGGERRRLVEEEQFGVVPRRHHRPLPPFELQQADDPPRQLPRAADLALPVVQAPAVAHEQPAVGDRDDLAPRGHPVLSRHRCDPVVHRQRAVRVATYFYCNRFFD